MLLLCACKPHVCIIPAGTMLVRKWKPLFTENLDTETKEKVMITEENHPNKSTQKPSCKKKDFLKTEMGCLF